MLLSWLLSQTLVAPGAVNHVWYLLETCYFGESMGVVSPYYRLKFLGE